MYIQWSNDHRSLFSFEHLKETLGKKTYIHIYIYMKSLDSQSEAAFVVPQCVFFFVGCSQDRRKEGSSLGKGQVNFHGVWPKHKF